METKSTFACAINCMDGRIQDAVKNHMQKKYGVDYIDMITEPGPDKILAENTNAPIVENIKKRVEVSVVHHGAKAVAIVAHFGCAGNPVEKEQHIQHLNEAKKTAEQFGFPVEIELLWVDGDWKTVEQV